MKHSRFIFWITITIAAIAPNIGATTLEWQCINSLNTTNIEYLVLSFDEEVAPSPEEAAKYCKQIQDVFGQLSTLRGMTKSTIVEPLDHVLVLGTRPHEPLDVLRYTIMSEKLGPCVMLWVRPIPIKIQNFPWQIMIGKEFGAQQADESNGEPGAASATSPKTPP